MCGIVGYWDKRGADAIVVEQMALCIQHRGPDDTGIWVDKKAGIALGHRRLSIIDLTPAGHQPMTSESRRYVIVYNGEVYNFLELRRELQAKGHIFRGHSDTETILAAFEEWGINEAVKRANGMFAFALWDREEQVLWLCRDRLGIKPLYYARIQKGIVFGSELKAIRIHPDFDTEVNRDALTLYLRHNYIPAPYTIYKNAWKLRPGYILRIRLDDFQAGREIPQPYCYWDAKVMVESGQNNSFQGTADEAIEQLDMLLRDSIKKRMISDVPLGAFLSGGIDSSTVVALVQAQRSRPVKTFTIGSDALGYDEAPYSKEVARYLGTDHTELYISPKDAMDIIPKLPRLYDEPFSDSSQIPTFLVSKLAKSLVMVSLSGDGGDELFGGYNRHFLVPRIWGKLRWIHPLLRTTAAKALQGVSPGKWDSLFYKMNRFLPARMHFDRVGDNIYKFLEILPISTPELIYYALCSHWKNPEDIVIGGNEPLTNITNPDFHISLQDLSHWMMYKDLISYLPDDILTKVDRASMGVSLEARVPILDHRVVEFAWSLPLSMKIRNGQGKWILRQVLYKYVPKELVERPKAGFGIPIDSWLRGPLRGWAEALLDEARLRREGFFNPVPIRRKWTEHLSGKRNWQYYLWDILMFQAWLEAQ